ncbi:hypothetical protein GZL_00329 [Streptomyces sp. 769]|nr:hypothetical protein GZL_00329 [Streptomyces sp. 769]
MGDDSPHDVRGHRPMLDHGPMPRLRSCLARGQDPEPMKR